MVKSTFIYLLKTIYIGYICLKLLLFINCPQLTNLFAIPCLYEDINKTST